MITEKQIEFMQEAIALAQKGMDANDGGPFGAVVVFQEQIIGRGWNQVTSTHDPTAHAEVVAIREACKTLKSFQLTACEIYTSCEPCPMCLGAIYWARPKAIYFANTRKDAAEIGFDDDFLYQEMKVELPFRKIPMIPLLREQALKIFTAWTIKVDKTKY